MDDDCCCELCQSSSITSNNNNINKQNQSKNLRILWADTFDEQSKQQLSEELSLPCNGNSTVPTLPLAIAVLFCMLNLLLPGSGTFLASFAIIFGSQTEYGSGYGYQAFLICFLSSLLQFITAIFVFGWVWSIMWGIVFIKNSLRYGQKRDIHTISLC
ncbi:hypothetical protein DERP_007070 [Dermatophagoides pteronyssinus]|uniref:Protein stum homolog n=1 Tax=Dermatophagoides pteronyssinus TaxID=6956 RepID=A0ABQ8JUM5_DERPT|nr:hypothetical protein DERP_007070 [Dermatophagoides pteronyssinus]